MRRILRSLVPLWLCAALVAACGDAPTRAQCERLLDHVLELEVQAAGANTPETRADLDKQKQAVADSIRKEFMDTCLDKLPRSEVNCGLGAKTMDELAKCDRI
jgi:hypothetical protein